VHVYAHGEASAEEGGRLYLVTQLIPDGDLGGLLQAYGAPPPATALDLMAQVADGLADAHAAGLIHRDIKPANVLLRRRQDGNQAYLSDFGIARHVEADPTGTTTGTMGTPTYMAPELHLGEPPSVASDVYSLGCLFWAALTGSAPYAGTSDYQVVTAHLEAPLPQLEPTGSLAVAANRILRTAMAKSPGDRYPSAAEMRDDLRKATRLGNDPVSVAAPAADEPPGPATSPAVLIGAAVLVVVVAVVGGIAAPRLLDDGPKPGSGATPGSTPTTSGATTTPTETSSASPTATGSADETAIRNFADGLHEQGVLSEDQSTCVARDVVQAIGLDQLVAAGFFDADLTFLNPDLADHPEIKNALTSATLTCLT